MFKYNRQEIKLLAMENKKYLIFFGYLPININLSLLVLCKRFRNANIN